VELRELDMRYVKGESQVKKSKAESTKERVEDGPTCKSVDAAVMAAEQRGWVTSAESQANSLGG
jgi:hypothetical protein